MTNPSTGPSRHDRTKRTRTEPEASSIALRPRSLDTLPKTKLRTLSSSTESSDVSSVVLCLSKNSTFCSNSVRKSSRRNAARTCAAENTFGLLLCCCIESKHDLNTYVLLAATPMIWTEEHKPGSQYFDAGVRITLAARPKQMQCHIIQWQYLGSDTCACRKGPTHTFSPAAHAFLM